MGRERLCTVLASTKRGTKDPSTQRRGTPTTFLSSLRIMPLYSVSDAILKVMVTSSPKELKETIHVPIGTQTLPDVKEGDTLVIGSIEYMVSFVKEWSSQRQSCLQIVVQEQKQNV
jgi:hypothetical protein